jgi:hypothetical protein
MQRMKLSALSFSLLLAVAGSAAAQNSAAPDPPSADDSPMLIVVPAPQPVPDPAAVTKCQMLSGPTYWDCVNSYHGGG